MDATPAAATGAASSAPSSPPRRRHAASPTGSGRSVGVRASHSLGISAPSSPGPGPSLVSPGKLAHLKRRLESQTAWSAEGNTAAAHSTAATPAPSATHQSNQQRQQQPAGRALSLHDLLSLAPGSALTASAAAAAGAEHATRSQRRSTAPSFPLPAESMLIQPARSQSRTPHEAKEEEEKQNDPAPLHAASRAIRPASLSPSGGSPSAQYRNGSGVWGAAPASASSVQQQHDAMQRALRTVKSTRLESMREPMEKEESKQRSLHPSSSSAPAASVAVDPASPRRSSDSQAAAGASAALRTLKQHRAARLHTASSDPGSGGSAASPSPALDSFPQQSPENGVVDAAAPLQPNYASPASIVMDTAVPVSLRHKNPALMLQAQALAATTLASAPSSLAVSSSLPDRSHSSLSPLFSSPPPSFSPSHLALSASLRAGLSSDPLLYSPPRSDATPMEVALHQRMAQHDEVQMAQHQQMQRLQLQLQRQQAVQRARSHPSPPPTVTASGSRTRALSPSSPSSSSGFPASPQPAVQLPCRPGASSTVRPHQPAPFDSPTALAAALGTSPTVHAAKGTLPSHASAASPPVAVDGDSQFHHTSASEPTVHVQLVPWNDGSDSTSSSASASSSGLRGRGSHGPVSPLRSPARSLASTEQTPGAHIGWQGPLPYLEQLVSLVHACIDGSNVGGGSVASSLGSSFSVSSSSPSNSAPARASALSERMQRVQRAGLHMRETLSALERFRSSAAGARLLRHANAPAETGAMLVQVREALVRSCADLVRELRASRPKPASSSDVGAGGGPPPIDVVRDSAIVAARLLHSTIAPRSQTITSPSASAGGSSASAGASAGPGAGVSDECMDVLHETLQLLSGPIPHDAPTRLCQLQLQRSSLASSTQAPPSPQRNNGAPPRMRENKRRSAGAPSTALSSGSGDDSRSRALSPMSGPVPSHPLVARAMRSFTGVAAGQLSFTEGEELTVRSRAVMGWISMENSAGKRGHVPEKYCTFTPRPVSGGSGTDGSHAASGQSFATAAEASAAAATAAAAATTAAPIDAASPTAAASTEQPATTPSPSDSSPLARDPAGKDLGSSPVASLQAPSSTSASHAQAPAEQEQKQASPTSIPSEPMASLSSPQEPIPAAMRDDGSAMAPVAAAAVAISEAGQGEAIVSAGSNPLSSGPTTATADRSGDVAVTPAQARHANDNALTATPNTTSRSDPSNLPTVISSPSALLPVSSSDAPPSPAAGAEAGASSSLEARCLFDFHAQAPGQLSVVMGAVVTVLPPSLSSSSSSEQGPGPGERPPPNGWIRVQNAAGERGHVPENYFEIRTVTPSRADSQTGTEAQIEASQQSDSKQQEGGTTSSSSTTSSAAPTPDPNVESRTAHVLPASSPPLPAALMHTPPTSSAHPSLIDDVDPSPEDPLPLSCSNQTRAVMSAPFVPECFTTELGAPASAVPMLSAALLQAAAASSSSAPGPEPAPMLAASDSSAAPPAAASSAPPSSSSVCAPAPTDVSVAAEQQHLSSGAAQDRPSSSGSSSSSATLPPSASAASLGASIPLEPLVSVALAPASSSSSAPASSSGSSSSANHNAPARAVALYDFFALQPGQLSFDAGAVFTLFSRASDEESEEKDETEADGSWVRVQNEAGERGLVPAKYLRPLTQDEQVGRSNHGLVATQHSHEEKQTNGEPVASPLQLGSAGSSSSFLPAAAAAAANPGPPSPLEDAEWVRQQIFGEQASLWLDRALEAATGDDDDDVDKSDPGHLALSQSDSYAPFAALPFLRARYELSDDALHDGLQEVTEWIESALDPHADGGGGDHGNGGDPDALSGEALLADMMQLVESRGWGPLHAAIEERVDQYVHLCYPHQAMLFARAHQAEMEQLAHAQKLDVQEAANAWTQNNFFDAASAAARMSALAQTLMDIERRARSLQRRETEVRELDEVQQHGWQLQQQQQGHQALSAPDSSPRSSSTVVVRTDTETPRGGGERTPAAREDDHSERFTLGEYDSAGISSALPAGQPRRALARGNEAAMPSAAVAYLDKLSSFSSSQSNLFAQQSPPPALEPAQDAEAEAVRARLAESPLSHPHPSHAHQPPPLHINVEAINAPFANPTEAQTRARENYLAGPPESLYALSSPESESAATNPKSDAASAPAASAGVGTTASASFSSVGPPSASGASAASFASPRPRVKKLRDTRSASAGREVFIAQLNARLRDESASPALQAGDSGSSLAIPSGPVRSSSVGATPDPRRDTLSLTSANQAERKRVSWAPEPALVNDTRNASVEAAYATDPMADAAEEAREAEELRLHRLQLGINDDDEDDELSPEQRLQATMLRSPHSFCLAHEPHPSRSPTSSDT